jgi:predicted lipoprotein with Yx(FWY)xxD motif
MLRKLGIVLMLLLLAVGVIRAQDATESAEEGTYTVGIGDGGNLGKVLVGPNGMTLYVFTPDPIGASVCKDKCLQSWPALTVKDASELKADEEIPGTFGTITREDDGSLQVTYNGLPLYYWKNDKQPGDTTGNGVGNVWYAVSPSTLSIHWSPDLGAFLVGPNGMTAYMFKKDSAGTSACTGDCAKAWPPVTVDSADAATVGINLPGKVGTIKRDDGSFQVTYNDMPLYTYAKDAKIGDTTGNDVGDVWYVVSPETVVVAKNDALGDILTGPNGMTLYTFANDKDGTSACADDCAKAWPPLVVGAKDHLVAGAGASGKLGTITRADKKIQVTYNGQPLYYYAKDAKPGDTTGDKVGNVWNVAKP